MNKFDFKLADFNYNLPENLIPKIPLEQRDHSRLLVYKENLIQDSVFYNLNQFITEKSTFVVNDTKVIHARLFFKKETGAIIEIFCLEPVKPFTDIALAMSVKNKTQWKCLVRNAKKWKNGILNLNSFEELGFTANLIEKTTDSYVIEFDWNENITFAEILDKVGKIPIPPYFNRDSQIEDEFWYQTQFGKVEGAVAAPTAALHFTSNLIQDFKNQGNIFIPLTLHIGAGTFKPVEVENVENHVMHNEQWHISINSLKKLLENHDTLIAVGTTSLRTLESLYWSAYLISKNSSIELPINIPQFLPYNTKNQLSWKESLHILIDFAEENKLNSIIGNTQIIIVPGYKIKSVQALITNFHQPKSTLLMLVSALVGDNWKKIYDHAIQSNYRFLSYGDSSILFNNK